MTRIVPIDLEHLGLPGAICSYLVLGEEPALVDPGPSTTLERLLAVLAAQGLAPHDLRHLLLTHVHLDHAGASGHLAALNPRLTVHVHLQGAPHMADPEKLVASTRRTFGDNHDRFWGEVRPVPADRIEAWEPGVRTGIRGMRGLPTPGHIGHHVGWLDELSGTLLSGDALGIILAPGSPTHPPTPPPAVDVEAWRNTLDELAGVGPEAVGVAHFGLHGDVPTRRDELRERLDTLEARVREAVAAGNEGDARDFDEEVRDVQSRAVPPERVQRYFDTFPASMDWEGMRIYLARRAKAAAG